MIRISFRDTEGLADAYLSENDPYEGNNFIVILIRQHSKLVLVTSILTGVGYILTI